MAKPDCDDSFVMIALELFAVLASYDLPKREWIVLAEVLMRCYGPGKSRRVHVDFPAVEHYSGLGRNNARRGLAALVGRGMLEAHDDGSVSFVKDYERWSPRPEPGSIRFGISAPGRFGKPRRRINSRPTPTGVGTTVVTDSNGSQLTTVKALQRESGNGLCEGLGIEEAGARAPEEDPRLEKREIRTPLGPPTGGAVCVDESPTRGIRTRRRGPAPRPTVAERAARIRAAWAAAEARERKEDA